MSNEIVTVPSRRLVWKSKKRQKAPRVNVSRVSWDLCDVKLAACTDTSSQPIETEQVAQFTYTESRHAPASGFVQRSLDQLTLSLLKSQDSILHSEAV